MIKIFEKSRYLRKILILAEIIEKFRFGWKLLKILILVEIYQKSRFFVEIF